MKKISLTHDKVALVDDADFKWLSQWRWLAWLPRKGGSWYVVRWSSRKEGNRKMFRMHRILLEAPKGFLVDHKNGNGLDNQRKNIRLCTGGQNQQSQHRGWGASKFKGVSRDGDKWRAQMGHNGKSIYLGCYLTETEAARAYDKAALKHFGEYARTNKMLGLLQ